MSATNHSEISVTDESRPQESVGAPATAPEKTATEKRPPPNGLNKLVVALSIYAALRILVFAAAFPLFNNVDERVHLMSIQMYAQGHLPAKELPQMDPALAKDYLRYWSPEYGRSQEGLERNGIRVPLYRLSDADRKVAYSQAIYAQKLEEWLRRANFEAQSPPLYYMVAAGWYRLGTAFGIRGWALLYWVRFLNAIAYGLFVWISYRFVRKVYPERGFLCLAVPALIAVFPQDVFFGMNRDVLSPLVCAAALLFMANAIADKKNRLGPLLVASLLVGTAFLVEVSNFVFYGALAGALWIWMRRSQATLLRKVWVASASGAVALLLPSLWMLRNYLVIGDLTGGGAKMHELGWTVTPLRQVLHHPLFTWHGLSYFLVRLTENFWHGEYGWHGTRMRSAVVDWFYVISSVLMIALFLVDFARRRGKFTDLQRWTGSQSLALIASSVLFLFVLSLVFDYHNHGYPSRLYPYFVSGRIISGVLLPIVLIYASGLEQVADRFQRMPPVAVLACLMLLITVSEIRVRREVFSSPYNFFALTAWRR